MCVREFLSSFFFGIVEMWNFSRHSLQQRYKNFVYPHWEVNEFKNFILVQFFPNLTLQEQK